MNLLLCGAFFLIKLYISEDVLYRLVAEVLLLVVKKNDLEQKQVHNLPTLDVFMYVFIKGNKDRPPPFPTPCLSKVTAKEAFITRVSTGPEH
jgi:hypothetical protein